MIYIGHLLLLGEYNLRGFEGLNNWLGWGNKEYVPEFWWGNLFGNAHFEDQEKSWRIIKSLNFGSQVSED
jgi:hypothetical protein